MINKLEIKNFKSIKSLSLDCKRINIFIGEPNTGKSNILETLGLYSFGRYANYGPLKDFVRYERTSQLFYDENESEEMVIRADDIEFKATFKQGFFNGIWHTKSGQYGMSGNYNNLGSPGTPELSPFKFYKFVVQSQFPQPESEFLLPPSGSNLMSLLLRHTELYALADEIFSPFGLELGIRRQENKLELIKKLKPTIISYPYALTSDTLQRTIFHLCAIMSNKDSILIFEEPESHAFPWHTKYLAETIALDKGRNQYFISTHNPYFLLPLLEKSPKEEITINIIYYEDYQTKRKLLQPDEMDEIMQIDVFSNLNRYREMQ
ncbi:MAG: AAA family ATPase [Chloroflexi bacterium]|nr:AAA family ATPase [Chloroflexota bacterium]